MVSGYYAGYRMPAMRQRLLTYHTIVHMGSVAAICGMFLVSYYRLTGFWENGLRWNTPDYRMRKLDTTSVFEANTIWKHFRINLDK